ncbi:hypothetical protein K505DRAFT_22512 [Melanomma pulvis-pyrius CBS 109.77]|uniref:Uncharacterized protein n=1 Tax=Melanomma pulvis-pyrius CBS 109.77 TaxID=1314802 RepID=A0A6A6XF83_9PLEO|nr:hypothetical protein K505DRAFT_22512 [Melanomma pulvis-pyrius CBS 109.77]
MLLSSVIQYFLSRPAASCAQCLAELTPQPSFDLSPSFTLRHALIGKRIGAESCLVAVPALQVSGARFRWGRAVRPMDDDSSASWVDVGRGLAGPVKLCDKEPGCVPLAVGRRTWC